ncbi:MAG: PD-(D/E)XK nuclease family protein [Verrucomicrobiota bacterium]
MIHREFLGWDEPFIHPVTAWLLARRTELPAMILVAPTAQSGRLLRDSLVEKAGAILAPRILTPGALMRVTLPECAEAWQEQIAWMETLAKAREWAEFAALFPEPPVADDEAAITALAQEFTRLRTRLQENGLMLADAARRLAKSVEGDRWSALQRLETEVEARLNARGLKSRSSLLAGGFQPDLSRDATIVLAGITDLTPLVERILEQHAGPVIALIPAPESEAEHFSLVGRPLENWSSRPLASPADANGATHLTAGSRDQATAALSRVRELGATNDQIALASADPEVARELADAFTLAGWPAFVPAAPEIETGARRWFAVWRNWLVDPRLAAAAELLTLPQTDLLIGGGRASIARELARLRDGWIAIRPADIARRMEVENFRDEESRERVAKVRAALDSLLRERQEFLAGSFAGIVPRLCETLSRGADPADNSWLEIATWAVSSAPWTGDGSHSNVFWLGLMLSALAKRPLAPPDDRVLDVSGWLELLFNPGRHLLLCGANDGSLPPRDVGDPWLGAKTGEFLGLATNTQRAARDAFLFHSLILSRRAHGSADVFLAKSNNGGESLLPSRLLLATTPEELPHRVKQLFKEVDPPDSRLIRETMHRWQPPHRPAPENCSVTALKDYLACPFRFYLKHMAGMKGQEPGRVQWNARDFGNVLHTTLETWALDPEAREFSKTEALTDYLHALLARIVARNFGPKPPLAIRIQKEALAQRLAWFSRSQAILAAEGWRIIEVEKKIELPLAGHTLVARIDRIDQHRDTGEIRVIDYKTGKNQAVVADHLKPAPKELPGHLLDSPASFIGTDAKGAAKEFLWTNLQLPLYAAVLAKSGPMPVPCYFRVPETERDTGIDAWSDFTADDLDAALRCAEWILGRIDDGVFWPPVATTRYDDFAVLAAGRTLEETCAAPAAGNG